MKNRVLGLLSLIGVGLALASAPCAAQFLTQEGIAKSGLVDKTQAGEIDWGKEFYYSNGEGVIPGPQDEPNRAKAYLKGKGYAKMKAIANLLMAIEGTTISYRATGKDYIAKDETLQQTIEGFVANVEAVEEKQESVGNDTLIIVTVRAPMYGPKGVGSAILKSKIQQEATGGPQPPVGVNVEKHGDVNAATVLPEAKGPFTCLIVDCRELAIERAMSPKIRRADSSEVWGTVAADHDFLQEHGMVAYARGVDEAKSNRRAGTNPLVLKAIGRAGGRFMCDAVISDADAERVLKENQDSHFLDKFNVLFVVDGK